MRINDIFAPESDQESLDPCFIIAEIGTSHQGDRVKAKELIQAAAESGAHCVKSQYVIAGEILHPLTGTVDLPTGKIALFDVFKNLEQNGDFYLSMAEECRNSGVEFLCSPFGLQSAAELEKSGVVAYKIASPELNHFPLLRQVASYKKPVILSTGVSLLKDIEAALSLFSGVPVALLHCITAYPAPAEEYNLRLLGHLEALFGLPCGVSDHSLDPLLVPCISLAAGSRILEKHFTLSKETKGLDDPIALVPGEFRSMTRSMAVLSTESRSQALARVKEQFGAALVEKILGTGKKVLAPSEKANYSRTNRSIHAMTALKKGEILSEDNMALLRTEKQLSVGADPALFSLFKGKRLQKDLENGQGITLDDILPV